MVLEILVLKDLGDLKVPGSYKAITLCASMEDMWAKPASCKPGRHPHGEALPGVPAGSGVGSHHTSYSIVCAHFKAKSGAACAGMALEEACVLDWASEEQALALTGP